MLPTEDVVRSPRTIRFARAGDDPVLRSAIEQAAEIDALTTIELAAFETLRSTPPEFRTKDARSWGPTQVTVASGTQTDLYWFEADLLRPEGETPTYALRFSETSGGPYIDWIDGTMQSDTTGSFDINKDDSLISFEYSTNGTDDGNRTTTIVTKSGFNTTNWEIQADLVLYWRGPVSWFDDSSRIADIVVLQTDQGGRAFAVDIVDQTELESCWDTLGDRKFAKHLNNVVGSATQCTVDPLQ